MSFFSQLKRAARFVTGGGAEVRLDILDPPSLGAPFRVRAAAHARQELAVEKVYVTLRFQEKAGPERADEAGEAVARQRPNVLFQESWTLAGPSTLAEGEQAVWEGVVDLSGMNAPLDVDGGPGPSGMETEWRIRAGLAAPGADPASAWLALRMARGSRP